MHGSKRICDCYGDERQVPATKESKNETREEEHAERAGDGPEDDDCEGGGPGTEEEGVRVGDIVGDKAEDNPSGEGCSASEA